MVKKPETPATAYGTKLKYKGMRNNRPVKSRYMAAALAMIFGIFGVNQFYLRNIIRGILKIFLTLICFLVGLILGTKIMLIPVFISLITGFIYLIQSDAFFARYNRARTI